MFEYFSSVLVKAVPCAPLVLGLHSGRRALNKHYNRLGNATQHSRLRTCSRAAIRYISLRWNSVYTCDQWHGSQTIPQASKIHAKSRHFRSNSDSDSDSDCPSLTSKWPAAARLSLCSQRTFKQKCQKYSPFYNQRFNRIRSLDSVTDGAWSLVSGTDSTAYWRHLRASCRLLSTAAATTAVLTAQVALCAVTIVPYKLLFPRCYSVATSELALPPNCYRPECQRTTTSAHPETLGVNVVHKYQPVVRND